jgi:nucleotide-binding universal stress UspA family protein
MRVLMPIDGSSKTLAAIRRVAQQFARTPGMEVHLLNVQPAFSMHISRFLSRKSIDRYQQDEATHALTKAREALASQNIPHAVHIAIGPKAELIAETATRLRCDHIIMSTARKDSFTRMLEDSVTNRVIELTKVPVEVVSGEPISSLEKYGIPIGIGAAIGVVAIAVAD